MKSYYIFIWVLLLTPATILGANPQTLVGGKHLTQSVTAYGSVTVNQWADNKKSAFTFDFDGGKASQYNYARPILDKYGIKATFFVITGELTDSVQNWNYGYWWQFDSLAHEGNEIGSHSVTEPDLIWWGTGSVSNSWTINYELYQSKHTIEEKIPGYKCISLAYPYCEYNDTVMQVASQYYEAARTCGSYMDSANISGMDFYRVQGVDIYFNHPRGTLSDDEAFNIYTNNVTSLSINTGGWANYFAADILPLNQIPDSANSDTTIVSTYFLDKLCNWASAESASGNMWISTFGNVSRYIKERENFSSNIVSSTSSRLEISTSIGSLDTSIYNYPLTVDITVPSNWKKVTVISGNQSETDSAFYNGSDYVIRANIVPGKGNIVLSIGSFYSISGHVYYDNTENTPISNVKIIFSSSTETDSAVTNSSGMYSYNYISPGTYKISITKNDGWSGVNSTDALYLIKYLSNKILPDSLLEEAADVNNDGSINSSDAAMIIKKYLNKISSFNRPDWIFSNPGEVTITNKNVTQDFKGIAAGDVNKSYNK